MSRQANDKVRARVLEKGHDRVFTGDYDARALKFTKFAAGQIFDTTRDIAEALAARGFVAILDAAVPTVSADESKPARPASGIPDDPTLRANWCQLARERLVARAERDAGTGCLNWRGARGANGYGGMTFLGKSYITHRLSWFANRGPIPKGLHVCHRCDNRLCIEPEHLFLGTPQQNTLDMIRKGRGRVFGAGRERLQQSTVASIKRRLREGEAVSDLAREMKVSINTIGDIKRGRTWTFVDPA